MENEMQQLYGPYARIALRYGVAIFMGEGVGDALAGDPDMVFIVAGIIGASVEASYALAKRNGWAT
jgi:hypothetical protein